MTNLKPIKIGHEKLIAEVNFWSKAYRQSAANQSDGYQLANAQRALQEFEKCYESQLATLKKYPFLGK